jgi:hypothetical protein
MSAPEVPENFRASFRLDMRDAESTKDIESAFDVPDLLQDRMQGILQRVCL